MTTESYIRFEDLPDDIRENSEKMTSVPLSLEDVENQYIKKVIDDCSGNKSKAADVLKISRRALLRKIQKCGLKN